jgi:hypothetical protein
MNLNDNIYMIKSIIGIKSNLIKFTIENIKDMLDDNNLKYKINNKNIISIKIKILKETCLVSHFVVENSSSVENK